MAKLWEQAQSLFGWAFVRQVPEEEAPSFAPKQFDDGAVQVVATGGAFGTVLDLDGTVRSEAELITRYRDMSLHPEVDAAIDEIVNESISTEEEDVVRIKLDKLKDKLPPEVMDAISQCFVDVTNLLDFQNRAYDIFRRWYVDGRLYFHVILPQNPQDMINGIKEVRYIDPRKIRKIREVAKQRVRGGDLTSADSVITQTKNEYFIYNDKGFNIGNKIMGPTTQGLKIAKDAVVYTTSGATDSAGTMVLSYLHKAIKVLNQVRTMEDALVIYRLVRAPERRVWYIDVGSLPKAKAEQYMGEIIKRHKNKLNYDAQTGAVRDDRKFMTMLEDYWLPRREGGRGTEVDTLPAGETLGQIDDIVYFQQNLYKSLHVPVGRLDSQDMYNPGAGGIAAEISRDELKFGKFIARMRNRFAQLFIRLLEKQIVLKNIMTIEDYAKISPYILFEFARDNYTTEQKNQFLMNGRTLIATALMPFIGRYYSHTWIRKNVFMQDDQDIMENDAEIVEEMQNPILNPPMAAPEEEGESDDDGSAGMIVDPGMAPPDAAEPKPKPAAGKKKSK